MNNTTKKQSDRYKETNDPSHNFIDQFTSTNLLNSMYKQQFPDEVEPDPV